MADSMLPVTDNGTFNTDVPPSPMIAPPTPGPTPQGSWPGQSAGPMSNPLQDVMDMITQGGSPTGPTDQAPGPYMQQLAEMQAGQPAGTPGAQTPGGSPAASGTRKAYDQIKAQVDAIDKRIGDTTAQTREVQKRLMDMTGADGLKKYLPNGGKQKATDVLSDMLYNFSQLQLRNPTYGALAGQAYKPIEVQRMEEAQRKHAADIQNLTAMNASLNQNLQTDRYMANIQRQYLSQAENLDVKQQQQDLAVKKQQDLVDHQKFMEGYQKDLALAKTGDLQADMRVKQVHAKNMEDWTGNGKADYQAWFIKSGKDAGLTNTQINDNWIESQRQMHPDKPMAGIKMLVPEADGGWTAIEARPGQRVPEGARTAASASTDYSVPQQFKMMKVHASGTDFLANQMKSSLDAAEKDLGAPLKSQWTAFMAGRAGFKNINWSDLSFDAAALSSKLMQMHTGSRGSSEMLHHFANQLAIDKSDPDNLRATLGRISEYVKYIEEEPLPVQSHASKPAAIAPPPPGQKPEKLPEVGTSFGGGILRKLSKSKDQGEGR